MVRIRKTLAAALLALVSGCEPYQPSQYPVPSPPRMATPARPVVSFAPASLWVVNETTQWLDVYFDGYYECELAGGRKCLIDDIEPGDHLLRLVRGDGTTWQSHYDYAEDESVSCFATLRDVDCLSDFESFP